MINHYKTNVAAFSKYNFTRTSNSAIALQKMSRAKNFIVLELLIVFKLSENRSGSSLLSFFFHIQHQQSAHVCGRAFHSNSYAKQTASHLHINLASTAWCCFCCYCWKIIPIICFISLYTRPTRICCRCNITPWFYYQ